MTSIDWVAPLYAVINATLNFFSGIATALTTDSNVQLGAFIVLLVLLKWAWDYVSGKRKHI